MTRASISGVSWQEVRRGIAEIEGFSDSHLREFSQRRAQILEAAGGAESSARARQVANLLTREPKKDLELSTEALRERWADRASEIGLTCEVLEATMQPELEGRERTVLITEQLDRAVTANASHFDRRDAIQAVANSLPDGAPAHEVEEAADAFLRSPLVIEIAESAKGTRYTTKRIWELERKALESAERMRATDDRARLSELAVERVLAAHSNLKDDQAQMVRALLSDGKGLSIVIGQAGTGKTYATLTAAEAWARAGIGLTAAAPTWRAANVLRSEGLEATSIARLLGQLDGSQGAESAPLTQDSVLVIDEAGMVDSVTLARLIDHVQSAEAKLVLIGDPQQLREIEAGGLFAALAERSEPIVLDEVIRHHHEAEREGARLIREGEATAALEVYRSEERVVVASDAEARREAMVADWAEAIARGEDALMVAKRNAEVGQLNELARAAMREQGRLGQIEIEVGEGRFAAGDQVITRVNDHANQVYNRERWAVAEVDAQARRVVLDGIDTQRRVCVDAVYLERVNPRDGAPALQHAYAATTYCAQGTTVDRAFVCVDPSMDKQELYVAASRSREETLIYATPEIGAMGREEYAPRSARERSALETFTAAAQRDRAQTAAHEEARRSELRKLSSQELAAQRAEVSDKARSEQLDQRRYDADLNRIERAKEMLAAAIGRREAAEAAPKSQWVGELSGARAIEAHNREGLDRLLTEAEGAQPPGVEARQQAAAIEAVLAERRALAITAAQISPADYIKHELGERPIDPAKRKAWERGVAAIEGYRQEHGVKDRDRAFGAEPKDHAQRSELDLQRSRVAEQQRQLGIGQGADRSRSVQRAASLEIG